MNSSSILINTLPAVLLRYPTLGDWTVNGSLTHVSVLNTGNAGHNFAIAIHEAVESFLCQRAGVTQAQVDAWDFTWEDEVALGNRDPGLEPGDDSNCPYFREHLIASVIEQVFVEQGLMEHWEDYLDATNVAFLNAFGGKHV